MKFKRTKKKNKRFPARVLALMAQTVTDAQALVNALGPEAANSLPESGREPYQALVKTLVELHKITNSGASPARFFGQKPPEKAP